MEVLNISIDMLPKKKIKMPKSDDPTKPQESPSKDTPSQEERNNIDTKNAETV